MNKLARSLGLPLLMAAIAVSVLWGSHVRNPWALACATVAFVLAGSIAVDLVFAVRSRIRNTGENALIAVLRLLDANHRRYGSHVVHAGIIMIVVGITASSLYSVKRLVPLTAGQATVVGKYNIAFGKLEEVRAANYATVVAELAVTDSAGRISLLQPERRFYDKTEEANTQIALRSNWAEDLYVTLAGWEEGGKVVTFQVIVNPMVRWIWAGGLVMVLGAIGCLLPRFSPMPRSTSLQESRSATLVSRNLALGHRRRKVRRATQQVLR